MAGRPIQFILFLFLGGVFAFVLLSAAAVLGGLFKPGQPRRRIFSSERVGLLQRVAALLHAEVVNQPLRYRYPFLRVPDGSSTFLVILTMREESELSPYIVSFEAPIEGKRFIEAWPKGSPYQPFRMTSGLPEVTTGEADFDAGYIIRGDDVVHARGILTREVRASLARMTRMGRGVRVRFDLYAHKVVVQKEEQVADEATLQRLGIEFGALTAALRAALSAQSGVEFLDGAPKADKLQCPICGTELGIGRVDCRRCKTPHHQDCWEYLGNCATFACGEKRFNVRV